jgi:tetratricopeptide (TPR) repeat protein
MKGSVAEGLLPTVLRDLYVGRRSGFLHFNKGDERRSVYFEKGNIVHADTNVREERLGETLVGQGLLTEADLKRASGFMLRDRKRLGAVLVELGILDPNQLEDALAVHVREILLKVLLWSEGSYEFEAKDEGGLEPGLALKLSTGEIILEAVRRIQDPDVIRYALGDIDRVLGLSSDPLLRFQKITLSPADGYILSRIDGTLSAREVIQVIPMASEDAMRALFGLLCTGVIEYLPLAPKAPPMPAAMPASGAGSSAAPPLAASAPAAPPVVPKPTPTPDPRPAPAPLAAAPAAAASSSLGLTTEQETRRQEIVELFETLKAKNHFEMLGIPRASNEAQVKEAYFKLAKRFHPDTHHDPALSDLRDKIEAIFIRLGAAYEVLRDRNRRSTYEADLVARMPRAPAAASKPAAEPAPPAPDPEAESRVAQESVARAERLYAAEKYWDAIQLLEPALRNLNGKMLQRARVALARNYMKNPKWLKRAEEQLQSVVREDANHLESHLLLAGIYKTSGLKSRALHEYQRVLELKPDHEAAAQALLELGQQDESNDDKGQPGFLKKLFGKP